MSSASSRVFSACRALLAPASSASRTSSDIASRLRTTAAAAEAGKPKPKAKAKVKSKSRSKTKSSASPKAPRTFTTPTGILKANPVSAEMARFLGASEASRSGAVKQIWSYIKSHNLQNPADRREILCDEKLKSLFEGKDKVGFLEISKLLSRHFVKSA